MPWFVTRRMKLEQVDFVDEEFLDIYRQQRRLYMDFSELQKIFQKMRCMKVIR